MNKEISLFFTRERATAIAQELVGKAGVTGFSCRRAYRRGQFIGFTVTLQKGVMDYPLLEV